VTQDLPIPRVNPLLDLLDAEKPIFSIWVNYYGNGNDYQAAAAAQASAYDFLLYDLEHQPFDIGELRQFLWYLLDPAAIEAKGRRVTKPVIPRLPLNAREVNQNQWIIKQVLDTGVAGLMFPCTETAEEALNAVAAARYAQKPGSTDFLPEGKRGYSPAVPQRYWGLSADDYVASSDIWGLDPQGNLLLIFIIESWRGVENVRAIAKALRDAHVKAILWAGGGDMALSYDGSYGTGDSEATVAGVDAILAAGREFGLPVGLNSYQGLEVEVARGARAFFTVGPAHLNRPPITREARLAVGR